MATRSVSSTLETMISGHQRVDNKAWSTSRNGAHMELSVTFRHCPLKSNHCEYSKKRAISRLEQASRSLARPLSGRAVIETSSTGFRVELILKGSEESVVACCEDENPMAALDGAADKMDSQGRRQHSRRIAHRSREGRRAKEQAWLGQESPLPRHQPSFP
ncbi:MAG: hypothetical protein GY822_20785 [Deltaproteobacteria bacterium]|nr:hypothetical protein [Deltaproteobacteria bacterium]